MKGCKDRMAENLSLFVTFYLFPTGNCRFVILDLMLFCREKNHEQPVRFHQMPQDRPVFTVALFSFMDRFRLPMGKLPVAIVANHAS